MKRIAVALRVSMLALSIFTSTVGIASAEMRNSAEQHLYVLDMDVKTGGYFVHGGSHPVEVLELPRGPVKIVLHYADDSSGKSLDHQFAISNNATGFYLQSPLLSPTNRKAEMRFDAGKDGAMEYDIFCSISCDPTAMGNLFRKIRVVNR